MRRVVLGFLMMFGALCTWSEVSEYTVTTGTFTLDTRTTVGGRMLHGTERISPVAESENAAARAASKSNGRVFKAASKPRG